MKYRISLSIDADVYAALKEEGINISARTNELLKESLGVKETPSEQTKKEIMALSAKLASLKVKEAETEKERQKEAENNEDSPLETPIEDRDSRISQAMDDVSKWGRRAAKMQRMPEKN